jgi:hypothetical protein
MKKLTASVDRCQRIVQKVVCHCSLAIFQKGIPSSEQTWNTASVDLLLRREGGLGLEGPGISEAVRPP